jgi:hypothetical protein
MANESSNPGSGSGNQEQNQNQELYTGPQAQSEGLYGPKMSKVKNPHAGQENVYAETTDGLGYAPQTDQRQSRQQQAEERENNRETTPFRQHPTAAVYGEAPGETGHVHTPYQDMQPVTQPPQERQADLAQAQNWEREQQAGEVPGQQSGPTGGKDFEHASGMTGYYGGVAQQGQGEQEQEGQKVNVEQSHQTNTARYTGKPGVKAPSPGQEEGTAWGQDMESGNANVPARNPYGY